MRRLRILVVAAAVVAIALTLVACSSGTPTPAATGGSSGGTTGGGTTSAGVTVSMKDLAFNPATVDVAVGDSVTFVNDDTVQHDVAGDTWSSGAMDAGQSFTQKFTTAGANPVRCTIHPSMTMTVNVK